MFTRIPLEHFSATHAHILPLSPFPRSLMRHLLLSPLVPTLTQCPSVSPLLPTLTKNRGDKGGANFSCTTASCHLYMDPSLPPSSRPSSAPRGSLFDPWVLCAPFMGSSTVGPHVRTIFTVSVSSPRSATVEEHGKTPGMIP